MSFREKVDHFVDCVGWMSTIRYMSRDQTAADDEMAALMAVYGREPETHHVVGNTAVFLGKFRRFNVRQN